ncbi:cysteine-rich small domain-containing protein [Marinifilum sp. D737]|uniref:cysteine-rich small domain-containing protein n=1 Tax=Marinifilum sp. D737 TaxID=2969628 RepID=UPI0022764B67|nr:cysteine-rich small domain-containing protein [Marinifilum sp. D737]MCY1634123.1 cysteine-rich small domain-containing protein [Marinifilum sp. D737]
MSENYKFVQNTKCEYFPCHKVKSESEFNCLFCFCPLYMLGNQCGGNFTYTDNGIKNCSECTLPHSKNGYDHVMSKMGLVMERGRKKED